MRRLRSGQMSRPRRRAIHLPWVISGFLALAITEIVSVVIAVVNGRMPLLGDSIWKTVGVILFMTVLVGLLGAIAGRIFSWVRNWFGVISIWFKGILFFALISLIFDVINIRGSVINPDYIIIRLVTSALTGAVFVFIGLRLEKRLNKQQPQTEPPD
jgi:hypothetical protein